MCSMPMCSTRTIYRIRNSSEFILYTAWLFAAHPNAKTLSYTLPVGPRRCVVWVYPARTKQSAFQVILASRRSMPTSSRTLTRRMTSQESRYGAFERAVLRKGRRGWHTLSQLGRRRPSLQGTDSTCSPHRKAQASARYDGARTPPPHPSSSLELTPCSLATTV